MMEHKSILLAFALTGLGWCLPASIRDLDYNGQDRLDVYPGSAGAPVVVWVHGGGWSIGDKKNVGLKAKACQEQGCLFVSVNYTLMPKAGYREQAQDLAQAVAWVRGNIAKYGGDPNEIVLMGHSSGAHLVALVGTDESFLGSQNLPMTCLRGVILLDGAAYDVPLQLKLTTRERQRDMYLSVFGSALEGQKAASPIEHVEPGKEIPPFLLIPVERRADSTRQANQFSQRLQACGVAARVYKAADKTHETLNTELGKAGDSPTAQVFQFIRECTRPVKRTI